MTAVGGLSLHNLCNNVWLGDRFVRLGPPCFRIHRGSSPTRVWRPNDARVQAAADLLKGPLGIGRVLQPAALNMRVADRDDLVAVVCRARNKLVPAFSHSCYI